MALVAYDYDSGSDNEEDENSTASVIIHKKTDIQEKNPNFENSEKTESSVNSDENSLPQLLSHLPKTKSVPEQITEDKLEDFVPKYEPPKKEKPQKKVKITIPSLAEFKDDDEPEQKKIKVSSNKGSSLLSILPPAKGSPLSTKSFLPNVLKNKPPPTEKPKGLVPNAVRKNAELKKINTLKKVNKSANATGSDIESDDDIELPETFDDEMWHKVCGRPKIKEIKKQTEEVPLAKTIDIAPEPVKPYDGLDNAAFKELVGKSKRPVNIKLIDINEEEILPDKDLWLTKSLTDPDSAPKAVIENPVDPTRKKKHHITYLAEQAKANEQELQSQWAANKYTRNQTRAKYGF